MENVMCREYSVFRTLVNGSYRVAIEIFDWEPESDVGYLVFRETVETIGM